MKTKTSMLMLALAFAASLGAARAEVSFRDDFDGPALDSAWQVIAGLGAYSMTDNPGHLRYYLHGPRADGGACRGVPSSGGWSPSLSIERSFDGTEWTLRAKATYNHKYNGTGSQRGLIWVVFDSDKYVMIDRAVDQAYNANYLAAYIRENDTNIFQTDYLIAEDDVVQNDWIRYTYWIEIRRKNQSITLSLSTDGVNYSEVTTVNYSEALPSTQKVALTATCWATAGSYDDWDWLEVADDSKRATVTLVPSTTRPKPGAPFSVLLQADGEDMWAGQAVLGVDPARVTFASGAYGDLFDSSNRLEMPVKTTPAGTALLGSSLIRGAAPVTGTGALAVVNYQAGSQMGPTTIGCAALFAAQEGVALPTHVDPITIIIDDGIWGTNWIQGSIAFCDGSANDGINVGLYYNGELYRTVTTGSDGAFLFEEVRDGLTYTVLPSTDLFACDPPTVVVAPGTPGVTLPVITMYSGDLNSDGVIDIADVTLMAAAFGTSNGDQAYSETADINSDGTVNVLDLSILASHWGIGS